ncbi:unnamed protein product [Meganyctiphanes norvegica]|uniref:Transporter n=1 Tax=Meganyctiphanes norvegica TaxID=48144 RepID=A0AAV2RMM3_MEGNR
METTTSNKTELEEVKSNNTELEEVKSNKTELEEVKSETPRGNWDHPIEFILSCLGLCVGIGNVWRFPYLCFKNGGAVFLIPYCTMLFLACLPIFFMELVIGQYSSLGPVKVFASMAPISSGIGPANVIISTLYSIYYNLVLTWTLFYLFASFSKVLPWSHCGNDFNSQECYTKATSDMCRNQSSYYYNNTCESPENFCALGNLVLHNETHCEDITGEKIAIENAVPRMTSEEDYFENGMFGSTGHNWEDLGGIRWELVGCLALSWIIVAICLSKGIKSSGKVVYFTALFPYVILTILLVRGLTLDGAYKGLEFYLLKPNMTKLYEPEVWMDAASQIFYSTGVAFGALVTLASYNKFHNNCMNDAIIVVLSNSITSLFSGLVIFSMLGFLANELEVEVKDVVSSGTGLAFIVYPAIVSRMPAPQFWAVMFFTMLFTLGLDSMFASVETVTTALLDNFPSLRNHKTVTVFLSCTFMFLIGISMCLEGGIYVFTLFDNYACVMSLVIVGIIEVITIQHIFGFNNFMILVKKEIGIKMPKLLELYWKITMCAITPVSLFLILIFSLWTITPASIGSYIFPNYIQVIAWLLVASSVGLIPLIGLYASFTTKGSMFKPTADFCPAIVRDAKGK